jgi:hypothetical protein
MQPMPRLLPPRALRALLPLLALLVLATCARDVNKGENQEEPFPLQLDFMMELGAEPPAGSDNWYYFVFNFGTLGPTDTTRPTDLIVGPQRGRNWELYVAFNRDPVTGEELVLTDRRERLPTILPTLTSPVDATAGSFNSDQDPNIDLLVCSRGSNAVELFLGETDNFRDNNFFDVPAVTVDAGLEPLRIFASSPSIGGSVPAALNPSGRPEPLDLNDDDKQDALIIFGGGGAGAFLRPLLSAGDGTFTQGTAVPLTGIPVDAIVADFDTPGTPTGTPDIAVLTVDAPGGDGTVRIFTSAAGVFSAGPTFAVGNDPVQLAGGLIDTGNDIDIAVANAGDDDIDVYTGAADADFTFDSSLDAGGELQGVGINNVFGATGDVVFSFDDTDSGNVGAYLREAADTGFSATAITQDIERPAGPVVTFDAGADQRPDVFVLDRASSTTQGAIVIARSERITPAGTTTPTFAWAETPIIYSTANGPTRIVPIDLEGDGDPDLLIPNAGTGANGNNMAVYMNLGRYQFSSVDIYWTDGLDTPPEDILLQPWYLGHSWAGNRITLRVDATQFLSLADIPPEELLRGQPSRNYFIFDMMTATAPIDLFNKPLEQIDTGVVTEHFLQPVVVPMTIGFIDNNVTHDQVNTPVGPPERDITDWEVAAN